MLNYKIKISGGARTILPAVLAFFIAGAAIATIHLGTSSISSDNDITFSPKTKVQIQGGLSADGIIVSKNIISDDDAGGYDTALGQGNLQFQTTGYSNTAIGYHALYSNTTGIANVAVGREALLYNTVGVGNVAMGTAALKANTTGESNSAFGHGSLISNTSGYSNSAVGKDALWKTLDAHDSTGLGTNAGTFSNGNYNTFVGSGAGFGVANILSTGTANTILGASSFSVFTTGSSNVVVGTSAGTGITGGSNNTILGTNACKFISNGSNNICLGVLSGPSNDQTNSISIGYGATPFASNQVVLGNDSIASTLLKGNVGIGTQSPQSALQISGYVQLDLTAGSPPASDCDQSSERGRMKVDSSARLLYICTDSGWIAK
jgi:hypothetical protein